MSAGVLSPEETAKSIGIPIEELEAWIDHEIDKPCEMHRLTHSSFIPVSTPCTEAAQWIAFKKICPGCGEPAGGRFMCDQCKHDAESSQAICGGYCREKLIFSWIERIKK